MKLALLGLLLCLVIVTASADSTIENQPRFCKLIVDVGPCNGEFERHGYDFISNRCRAFIYGGCGGNPNRFHSEGTCRHFCHLRDENDKTENETTQTYDSNEDELMETTPGNDDE
ncbi:CG17380 [Drosophila busckii]|uniref:CG17380 n=1 Tax=Drosophila busckii TaxID=30019 RepID=A0A0M4EUU3_DROBS|nr:kunitz-type serine protease inhibitor PPTI [Drosophila busckii]ALC46930.1 CG17380 [Drosophila busckii]